jgi:hypothetical protein
VGSVTPSVGTSASLTAQTSAFSQSQVTPAISVQLQSQTSAFSSGTLGVGGDVTLQLSGNTSSFFAGQLTPVIAGTGKSHTSLYIKQVLVDYYTEAFKRPEVIEKVRAESLRKSTKLIRQAEVDDLPKIEALIEKAEKELAEQPDVVVANLVESALKFNSLVTDFNDFAKKRRQQEDLELLLFSMVL